MFLVQMASRWVFHFTIYTLYYPLSSEFSTAMRKILGNVCPRQILFFENVVDVTCQIHRSRTKHLGNGISAAYQILTTNMCGLLNNSLQVRLWLNSLYYIRDEAFNTTSMPDLPRHPTCTTVAAIDGSDASCLAVPIDPE